MGRQLSCATNDLTDYEAYIDHMVELRDGQLREVFQIPTSEMTQVASKEVASSPELFHMDRTTCELDKRPLFSIGILHSTKEFPVFWVTMVSGNQPSFDLFFNFKSIRGTLPGRGQS